MGGYDCEIYGKNDFLPTTTSEFWKKVDDMMFAKFGGTREDYNHIKYHNRLEVFESDGAIYAKLDW